jgi:hypothetical protein
MLVPCAASSLDSDSLRLSFDVDWLPPDASRIGLQARDATTLITSLTGSDASAKSIASLRPPEIPAQIPNRELLPLVWTGDPKKQ